MSTYRRAYYDKVKKWLTISGLVAIPTIIGLFAYLNSIGDINIIWHSGDQRCAGTEPDPCYAYLNFTMNKDYIYIYPNQSWYMDTDKPVRIIEFQVEDKRTKSGWRTIDLTRPCAALTPDTKCDYSYSYRLYKNKGVWSVRFVAYKNSPSDTIKWGFGQKNTTNYVDPYWLGTNSYNITIGDVKANLSLVDNTDDCFIDCYMVFNITLDNNLLVPNAKNFTAKFVADKGGLSSWGYQILQTKEWNETVQDLGPKENCNTNVTGTTCWNESIVIGEHNETRTENAWVDFNPAGFTFSKNKVYSIKLWGRKTPKLGPSNVDAKPIIAGNELPWQWWNSSWNSCRNISIVSISTDPLYNFTILVNVTKQGNMQSTYNDLRFVNDSCDKNDSTITTLSYEIENYSSTNAYVWVKIDTIPARYSNRTIAMYYNNSAATNGENRYTTWNANYTQVLHLNDTNTNRIDSSIQRDNGTAVGGTTTRNLTNSTGLIGWANTLDRIDDYIHHNITDNKEQLGTVEAWIKPQSIVSEDIISVMATSRTADNTNYMLVVIYGNLTGGRQGVIGMYRVTQGWCWQGTISTIGNGNWHHIAWVSNSTKHFVYVDGVLDTLVAFPTVAIANDGQWFGDYSTATTTDWGIMRRLANGQFYNGTMDELRVSNVNRSQSWINQTYQVIANNAQYVIFGNEVNYTAPEASSINCTYSGTGNWTLPCGCNVTANLVLNGTLFSINGTGVTNLLANVTNWTIFRVYGGCHVIVGQGAKN